MSTISVDLSPDGCSSLLIFYDYPLDVTSHLQHNFMAISFSSDSYLRGVILLLCRLSPFSSRCDIASPACMHEHDFHFLFLISHLNQFDQNLLVEFGNQVKKCFNLCEHNKKLIFS